MEEKVYVPLTEAMRIRGKRENYETVDQALKDLVASMPDAEVERFLARHDPRYWVSFDLATHRRHAPPVPPAAAAGAAGRGGGARPAGGRAGGPVAALERDHCPAIEPKLPQRGFGTARTVGHTGGLLVGFIESPQLQQCVRGESTSMQFGGGVATSRGDVRYV